MTVRPNISKISAVLSSPVRENILMALMSDMALTANELAREAGVEASTMSGHLRILEDAGLIKALPQGRFKYFKLQSSEIAQQLEALIARTTAFELSRVRPGPKDELLRESRRCYQHIAGRLGVRIYDSMLRQGYIQPHEEEPVLTDEGRRFFEDLGVDISKCDVGKKPLCKSCLDWSERRYHLAGVLGELLLDVVLQKGWVKSGAVPRALRITDLGRQEIDRYFP